MKTNAKNGLSNAAERGSVTRSMPKHRGVVDLAPTSCAWRICCGSPAHTPLLASAFSLVEILMTVAMLSVIILGLVAMFDQTRRAFTSSMTQVDVLEGGRAATALVANDLEQLTPAYSTTVENFYMQISPAVYSASASGVTTTQSMTDPNERRTNYLQQLCFVSRNNQKWNIIGYRLDQNGEAYGVGTLYRYSLNNIPVVGPIPASFNANSNLMSVINDFIGTAQTNNFTRVIDGVVDFRVRAFDTSGNLLPNINTPQNLFYSTNNIYIQTNFLTGEPTFYRFMSNAVPAFVEVELGILETRTLQRYYSMTNINNDPNNAVARGFLTNHAGQVHMFRQRIAIRAVDPTAYPFTSPGLP